jgi:translation initiation factor 6
MAVILADVFGSPNIGVYCFCNEKLAIVPPGLTAKKINDFSNALGVEVCKTTIGGSTLVGALTAGNSNGILVPHIIRDYEFDRINKFCKVNVVETNWTALGNVILSNDFGAVIHPDAAEELRTYVKDELKVQAIDARINNLSFVGSLAIATNKGAILSPNTSAEEQAVIEEALHVDVDVSTTNGGVPFVKSGILANSKGAVVGPLTRGAELMQITRTLGV